MASGWPSWLGTTRTHPAASEIAIVDVATGAGEIVAGGDACATGGRWLADGSLLYVSDQDGWFQVIRRSPDGRDRIVLTSGEREHGEPGGGVGHVPLPSPDGSRFVHIEVHDGFQDLIVAETAVGVAPKRGRGRPPKTPRTVAVAGSGRRIDPWDGVWRSVGWLADGEWVAAVGESDTRPQDLWLLPVPGVAPDDARPRQVTDFAADGGPPRPVSGPRCPDRALRHHRPRRAPGRREPASPAIGHRQARRSPRPHGALPARRPDVPDVPGIRPLQATAGVARASPSSTSISGGRPAMAARSARATTASGGMPMSTT